MEFQIITAFPDAFSYLSTSIVNRGREKGKIAVEIVDLRSHGVGKWRKIDDKPFGGGAGMLLQIEPIYRALKSVNALPEGKDDETKVVLTSARGRTWTQDVAVEYKDNIERMVIICGHYEGVDGRVVEHLIDEEISIGNFILSGGELASMVMVDSITRLIDGVVGNSESIEEETEFTPDGKIAEHLHYTRPAEFSTDTGATWSVPDVLLSGHHGEIEEWKKKHSRLVKE